MFFHKLDTYLTQSKPSKDEKILQLKNWGIIKKKKEKSGRT